MQNALMSKRPRFKTKRRKTFIREWRKKKGHTLAQLAERLLLLEEIDITEGQLSRIERGESAYGQDMLEAIARAMSLEPADLIMRNPTDPAPIWSIWDDLTPAQRIQLVAIGETLKKTG